MKLNILSETSTIITICSWCMLDIPEKAIKKQQKALLKSRKVEKEISHGCCEECSKKYF